MPRGIGKVGKTTRGFEIVKFRDRYGVACSVQASSLALRLTPGTGAIWLGCDDPDPRVMASKASGLGIQTTETTGWVPFLLPEEVLLNTRAHLDRRQVRALMVTLQRWLDTGSFSGKARR